MGIARGRTRRFPLRHGVLFIVPFAVIVAGLALALTPRETRAQGRLALEVEVGFNGAYASGRYTPVHVRLDYQGPPLSGELVLRQTAGRPLEEPRTIEVRRRVTLGQSARQRHTFSLPLSDAAPPGGTGPELTVSFLSGGRHIATRRVALEDPGTRDLLTLMASDGGYLKSLPTGEQVEFIRPEQFPTDWRGYAGVRRLYLGRVTAATLAPVQQEALRRWLVQGGQLVVLAGEHAHLQNVPWLRDLVPFQLEEVHRVDELGASIALGHPQGDVLYWGAGLPLLVRDRVGRGAVYYSALALTGSGEVEETLWRMLAPGEAEAAISQQAALGMELFRHMRLPYPDKAILIGIFALYIVGIGVLSLWVLRRPRWLGGQGELSDPRLPGQGWRVLLALGGWIGLFTAVTFAYVGQPAFTGQAPSLETGFIWGSDRMHLAHTESWYSVIAKRPLDLAWDLNYEVLAYPQGGTDMALRSEPKRSSLGFPERRVAAYAIKDFSIEAVVPLGIRVEVESEAVRKGEGRIYNESRLYLHEAAFMAGDTTLRDGGERDEIYYPLGDLPPGSAREVGFDEMGATAWPGARPGHGPANFEDHAKHVLYQAAKEALERRRPAWALLAWVQDGGFPPHPHESRRVLKLLVVTPE